MTHDTNDKGGRTAWIVVGSALLIGTALAIFVVFPNIRASAISIGGEKTRVAQQGTTMTAEACVEHAIDWFQACDVMPSMCLQEVPSLVAICLGSKDRTAECAPYIDPALPAQWTYEKCKGRGIVRGSDRSLTKSCTGAWRALDQFCKTGQKGVFWGVQ